MKVKSGFSLIEIMIAVVIIGIMATIGISAISGYRARASKTATVSMLTSLKNAVQMYYSDTGKYPQSLDELVDKPDGDDPLAKRWEGPYIEAKGGGVPVDGWNNEFQYERTPGGAHPFDLYSFGPEGEDAPEDERLSAW